MATLYRMKRKAKAKPTAVPTNHASNANDTFQARNMATATGSVGHVQSILYDTGSLRRKCNTWLSTTFEAAKQTGASRENIQK
jgi:hypothetical protein